MDFIYKLKGKDKLFLREKHGDLVKDLGRYLKDKRDRKIVAVGDYSSLELAKIGIYPDFSIIDKKIQRQRIKEEIEAEKVLRAKNPAHTITREAWEKVKEGLCYSQKVKLKIEGEEDLLALPSFILSPRGTLVVYGLRERGDVVVTVGRPIREKMISFLGLKREKIVCGGSFDRFHAGHKYFLLTAIEKAAKLFLGLTSDKYLKEKLGEEEFWPYQKRLNLVDDFLKQHDVDYEIFKIDDPYSQALKLEGSLLVTDETLGSGLTLNEKRKKIGKRPFTMIKIGRIKAEDGRFISSDRVRGGEIDLDGNILKPSSRPS